MGWLGENAFNNDIVLLKVWGNFFIFWCGLLFLSCARGVPSTCTVQIVRGWLGKTH